MKKCFFHSIIFKVCEEKEIKVPRLVCEEPAEKEAEDAETI